MKIHKIFHTSLAQTYQALRRSSEFVRTARQQQQRNISYCFHWNVIVRHVRAHLDAIAAYPFVPPERQTNRYQYRCGLVIYFALNRICSARMARNPQEPAARSFESALVVFIIDTLQPRDSTEPFGL